MNCPICNKSGLPDYTIEPVVCPQCNSDLKGFVILEQISSIHKRTVKKNLYIFSLLTILAVLISFYIFSPLEIIKKPHPTLQNTNSIIKELNAELKVKEIEINKLQSSDIKTKEVSFIYIVKRGDNLSKIAYFFYNDWKMYKKIEKDNNLKSGDFLYPKDTLIINLKTK